MSLCLREERLLRRAEGALCRSAPGLAAMFAVFSVFSAGAPGPAHEQVHTRMSWLWPLLAAAASQLSLLAARAGHACGLILVRAGAAWAAEFGMVWQAPRSRGEAGMTRGSR